MEQSLKRATLAVLARAGNRCRPLASKLTRAMAAQLPRGPLSLRRGPALTMGAGLLFLCCATAFKAAMSVEAIPTWLERPTGASLGGFVESTASDPQPGEWDQAALAATQNRVSNALGRAYGEDVQPSMAIPREPVLPEAPLETWNEEPLPRKIDRLEANPKAVEDKRPKVEDELRCLALTVYFEARGEPDLGKAAVAHVVLNRVSDGRFPDSICKVVRQGGQQTRYRCQFTWWCDGLSDTPRKGPDWELTKTMARKVFWGYSEDPTKGALWYHADYVQPRWASAYQKTSKIGQHIFYNEGSPEVDLVDLAR